MASKPLSEAKLVVDATPDCLDAIHAALEQFRKELTMPVPEDRWLRFATAVAEVSANVIRHAYDGTQPSGKIELQLRAYAGRIEAGFTDRGAPYDGSAGMHLNTGSDLFDPTQSDFPEGGLGLGLVRMAVDELHYSRSPAGLNHWRLVQQLGGADAL